MRPLVELAREHGMTLVVGAPVRTSAALHIGALLIEPGGTTSLYGKHHLGAFRSADAPDGVVPPPELSYFSPARLEPALLWNEQRCAVAICADSAHPVHAQRAAERGASLYLCCQFAIPAHMALKMSQLKQAARRHALTVVFANYGGPSAGLASGGSSCVRSSDGERVVSLPAQGCGLAVAWQEGTRWCGESVLAPHL